ncbi:MAG: hypothetical protein ACTSYE_10680 [Alphaproteobacteria bacterium]
MWSRSHLERFYVHHTLAMSMETLQLRDDIIYRQESSVPYAYVG